MQNVFILNGHHKTFGSPGALNAALADRAAEYFASKGCEIRRTAASGPYDIAEEVGKFVWADLVFLQMPVNWMGASWALKKYIDEVWMAGMMGTMSDGDGRSTENPKKNYGLGPKLKGSYMISATGNAPREAFNNPDEKFFDGLGEDDLLRPLHLNFKWIGLRQLPTFMAYDVMKNPEIENDFRRFDAHLRANF